jgi:hypothetical protein
MESSQKFFSPIVKNIAKIDLLHIMMISINFCFHTNNKKIEILIILITSLFFISINQ